MARTKKSASKHTGGKVPCKELVSKAARKTKPAEDGCSNRNENRRRSGVLNEIRNLQKSTNLLIRKKQFERLVRDIAQNYPGSAFNSASE